MGCCCAKGPVPVGAPEARPAPVSEGHPAVVCKLAACGKPSWNGKSGEYCSKACRRAGETGPRCLRSGCGKPTWNNKPHGFCSKACRDAKWAESGITFPCLRPGCGKPTWNSQRGSYCSKPCRKMAPPICRHPGCGKPTWNGRLDQYCTKECKNAARVCMRMDCGKPTWNGQPNEYCCRQCRFLGPPNVPAALAPTAAPKAPVRRLVHVADKGVLDEFQLLLKLTHKPPPRNWTRDRGCLLHGVNAEACSKDCCLANPVPVPAGYEVVMVEHVRDAARWCQYVEVRDMITLECRDGSAAPMAAASGQPAPPYRDFDVATSPACGLAKSLGADPLVPGVNEWRLFHGSSREACEGICKGNFSVELAGTGATWKKPGAGRGDPLYGRGIYFAEQITKADEYAAPPADSAAGDQDLRTVVLCRVVGGRPKVVTDDKIDPQALRDVVASGLHHSVVGDRIKKLGKPFREVVLYSSDQVFPEFLITYKRL